MSSGRTWKFARMPRAWHPHPRTPPALSTTDQPARLARRPACSGEHRQTGPLVLHPDGVGIRLPLYTRVRWSTMAWTSSAHSPGHRSEPPTSELKLLARADSGAHGRSQSLHLPAGACTPTCMKSRAAWMSSILPPPGKSTKSHSTKLSISKPRIGFFGVIDYRRPGPRTARCHSGASAGLAVRVSRTSDEDLDPGALPKASTSSPRLRSATNGDLPRYIAGWDVAMMPFAMNAANQGTSAQRRRPRTSPPENPWSRRRLPMWCVRYGEAGLAHIAESTQTTSSRGSQTPSPSPPLAGLNARKRSSATQSWDGIWARVSERLRAARRHLDLHL